MDRRAAQVPAATAEASRAVAGQPTAERIPRLAELPDGVRRELPPLTIGGSVNSIDADARMVIINGQVRREGEAVAAGLVLKRIRASSAVFEYKERLFELPF